MSKKAHNKEIKKKLEKAKYKADHPDECWCPENDVEFPKSHEAIDWDNPIRGNIWDGTGLYRCLICGKHKPIHLPHA